MGQALHRAVPAGLVPVITSHRAEGESQEDLHETPVTELAEDEKFPDLGNFPPEIALQVLKNLNATDLCLASCVWQQLATDNILWQGLCQAQWRYTSIYSSQAPTSYRAVYLLLDEGSLTFNSDVRKGMQYFISKGILKDNPCEIARFLDGTSSLKRSAVRQFLQKRQDVVEHLVSFQNYANTFLPNALRTFFSKLEAPNDRGTYLQRLLEKFSARFCQCNPGMDVDSVYVLCFSLILLSVDLSSPHVKNKMSKREFIRNTRGAVRGGQDDQDDLYGSLYDNVFLRGHIADQESKIERHCKQQYIPGYLALFL